MNKLKEVTSTGRLKESEPNWQDFPCAGPNVAPRCIVGQMYGGLELLPHQKQIMDLLFREHRDGWPAGDMVCMTAPSFSGRLVGGDYKDVEFRAMSLVASPSSMYIDSMSSVVATRDQFRSDRVPPETWFHILAYEPEPWPAWNRGFHHDGRWHAIWPQGWAHAMIPPRFQWTRMHVLLLDCFVFRNFNPNAVRTGRVSSKRNIFVA